MTIKTSLESETKPKRRLWLTLIHLAGLGVVGSASLSLLVGIFTAGVSTVLVAGVGLLILAGLVYLLFGVAWFEVARVDALYGFNLAPLYWQQRRQPGFVGWWKMIWRQAINASMWRAVANFALATISGALLLRLIGASLWGGFFTFSPLAPTTISGPFGFEVFSAWAPLVGPLVVIACVAAIFGILWLQHPLSRGIVAEPHRRAELKRQVEQSVHQREGAVRAADVERTRIERDLHDGVQPRLVSVGMTLGLARQKMDEDPAAAKELLEEAHTSTKAAITELRQLARGINASVLDDRGLDAALSALAGRSHIPVQLDVRLDSTDPNNRCRDAEAAVYFAVAESLTNAAKHSRASEVRVTVRSRPDRTIWARIEDNGVGGAQIQPGGGLDGIQNRIIAAGGTSRLESPVGGPTAMEVSVPCAS